jgi:hypothetical protein
MPPQSAGRTQLAGTIDGAGAGHALSAPASAIGGEPSAIGGEPSAPPDAGFGVLGVSGDVAASLEPPGVLFELLHAAQKSSASAPMK